MLSIPRSASSFGGSPGRLNLVRVGISIGALSITLAAFSIWQGFQISGGVEKARRAADTLQSLNTSEDDLIDLVADLPALHGTLSRVQDDLQGARSDLKLALPLVPLIGWVPGLGNRATEGRDMLSMGEKIVQGSLDMLTALDSVVQVSNGPVMLEGRRLNDRPFRALTAHQGELKSALDRFEEAEATQAKLLSGNPSPELERLLAFSDRVLPELQGIAGMGLAVSDSWGPFLGYEGPRSYLLVAQNADELRASGGYLPGAWLMDVDQGRIRRLEFWDTNDIDDLDAGLPTPPGGIVQSLWGGVWLFRDAGWYPDFPASAQVMERLFRLGTGHSVDGVVAVDQWAVKEILGAIGSITLPEGTLVNQASYFDVLEEGKDKVGRVFMDTILAGMLDGFATDSSSERFASLMLALRRALDQKHLLPYFHDEHLQEQVLVNGWGGALSVTGGDYLMTVDSNVGWNKVNRNMRKQVSYHVIIDGEGQAAARVDLTYTNVSIASRQDPCSIQRPPAEGTTYEKLKGGCYWNYLRVYVPEASRLQSSSPLPMPDGAIYRRLGYNDIEDTVQTFSEGEKLVYSAFFTVPPGATKHVTFAYELPKGLLKEGGDELTYSLTLQKQPGIVEIPATITVTVSDEYTIEEAFPRASELTEREAKFSLTLDSDQSLELMLRRAR